MADIVLKNVRLSFPHLFEPSSFEGTEDNKKYSTGLIIDPSTSDGKANAKLLKETIDSVVKETWRDKPPKNLKIWAIRNGDDSDREEYQGMIYLNAKSETRPLVVDRDKSPLVKDDGRPYAGCYVNASISVYATKGQYKTVSAGLRWVQFVKDGEAFGGGMASIDEIDDISTIDGETDAEIPDYFS